MQKSIILLLILLYIASSAFYAQNVNEQLRYEYKLYYPFAKKFKLENSFKYSTVLNAPKWHAMDYFLTLDWRLNNRLDFFTQAYISYIWQSSSANTFEYRSTLGARFRITPGKRIETRILLRYEWRHLKNIDSKEWQQAFRPRIKAEALFPFNKSLLTMDKVWYAIANVEFFNTTNELKERFADRLNVGVGVGYRLNEKFGFEFQYMLQKSRETTVGEYKNTGNIFNFCVKQSILKHTSLKLNQSTD